MGRMRDLQRRSKHRRILGEQFCAMAARLAILYDATPDRQGAICDGRLLAETIGKVATASR